MLHLIKMWLEMPVDEKDGRRGSQRRAGNRDEGRGTPQGAPISPLLSNLYMRRFILGWKRLGYEGRYGARIVNYADDLVICCRHSASTALTAIAAMMNSLGLQLNETKTHVRHVPEESVNFLGYTIGHCYSWRRNRFYIGTWPSRTGERRVRRRIHELTARRTTWQEESVKVMELNRVLVGWANYFCLGSVSAAYRRVQHHATERLRRWLCQKHRLRGRGYARYSDRHLHEEMGLVDLATLRRNFAWANT